MNAAAAACQCTWRTCLRFQPRSSASVAQVGKQSGLAVMHSKQSELDTTARVKKHMACQGWHETTSYTQRVAAVIVLTHLVDRIVPAVAARRGHLGCRHERSSGAGQGAC